MKKRTIIRFEELSFTKIGELDRNKSIIIIPVSPLEAHGPHLPIGTDMLVTEEICKEMYRRIKRKRRGIIPVMYPFQAFGYCGANKDVMGSVSVDVKAFGKIMHDTLRSLAAQGFRYSTIITFHLDPFYIKAIHRSIGKMERVYGMKVAEPVSKFFYLSGGISHAGKEETSIMLYLYPYLVDKIYKSLERVDIKSSILDFRKTLRELGAKDAYTGNPSEASIEHGRKLFNDLVNFCVESVFELMEGKYRNFMPQPLRYLPLFLQRK